MTEEKKGILEKVKDLKKVTQVNFSLNGRPEELRDTYTDAQRKCLMELYNTTNPYMLADFMSKLAMTITMSTNAAEAKLDGKNENLEWKFEFELTEKGKQKLLGGDPTWLCGNCGRRFESSWENPICPNCGNLDPRYLTKEE